MLSFLFRHNLVLCFTVAQFSWRQTRNGYLIRKMAPSFDTAKSSTKTEKNTNEMARSIEDVKMEYGIKYERMLNIHQEMQNAYVESQKNAEIHKDAYKDFVNVLKKDVFDKEVEIYNLKQEIESLKLKNEELEMKSLKPEPRRSFMHSKLDESKADLSMMKTMQKSVFESPIMLSSMQKIDLASPLCLPETPRCVSRVRRLSRMYETIEKATPTEQEDRDEFFKRIIMGQKEVLDFYATLTGYVAWKENLPQDQNGEDCAVDFFKMKPQSSSIEDMEIQFLVDYEQDDIEYHPVGFPDSEDGELDNFSPFLREKLYLNSKMAPQLLKALIDVTKT